jgi:hypothetical protein
MDSLVRNKVSVKVRGFLCEHFVTWYFLRPGLISASHNTQAGRPPLVGCLRLLIPYIRSYSPYWRPFLQPQREDAPCRGDQWRTQDFRGGGGVQLRTEGRENGDLGAVAP